MITTKAYVGVAEFSSGHRVKLDQKSVIHPDDNHEQSADCKPHYYSQWARHRNPIRGQNEASPPDCRTERNCPNPMRLQGLFQPLTCFHLKPLCCAGSPET